jgi:hypothetical protein
MLIFICQHGDQIILCTRIEDADRIIAETEGVVNVLPWDTDENPFASIYMEPM